MRTPARLALLVALLLAIAGCGGDDDGKDDGAVLGSGFEVEVPQGWRDATERADSVEFGGFRPDVVLVGPARNGFTPSVNVVREPNLPSGTTLDAYVEAGRRVLRSGQLGERRFPGGRVDLAPVRAGTLDGERAAVFDQVRTVESRRLRARQIVALRDGAAYTLTYTALDARFRDGARALEAVLSSWRWR